ncbi:MAG: reverse transcriptase domain-containing protein [Muribaculum sp.]|nr:reverse transcriptase domain-containing protein [Muribaculum sp.]
MENFFPSITKQMVRKALHRELGDVISSNDAINYICSLCTVSNEDGIEVLPQGPPASPVLSNIVLKAMDNKLAHYAELCGCRYSRYADDITFSHSGEIKNFSQFKQGQCCPEIHKVAPDAYAPLGEIWL